jgi:RNA polymerase sigma factor (sigma-70 family)
MSVSPTYEDRQRVAQLFDRYAGRVFAYARRHADRTGAEDLVAGAFEIALRRVSDLPESDQEALSWLIGTVRRLAANNRRRASVAERYWADQMRTLWHVTPGTSLDDGIVERDAALAALAGLSSKDREALLLVAWDGLTPQQAAVVTGCSVNAFTVRLHRARHRLQQTLSSPHHLATEALS